MNVFVFDIETIPDLDGGRRLYGLDGLPDEDVAKAMFHLRQQEAGTDFLRLHLHRVVAISAVYATDTQLKVASLGSPEDDERTLVQTFYDVIEKRTPVLVSWNGSGFDLPVLHYRALVHGIQAPRYWDMGEDDRDFKWNNYISRYHTRHLDLMDLIAMYQPRANAPLDEIATLLGFPGKMGMSGARVWDAWCNGQIGAIRDYCETDVLNTYLVYLRFELMRGRLMPDGHARELERLRSYLKAEGRPHFDAFLDAWAD
ncbi:3'-5' exonuclease [Thiohalobacter sp.]|uniref:3'-5' exonuclease n=1 Tax=Thiohalobacter sp. TaxID=2025948 RepID=UPI002602D7E6|nr:3'-5' exonuclease [Thiohalobacter sp.]